MYKGDSGAHFPKLAARLAWKFSTQDRLNEIMGIKFPISLVGRDLGIETKCKSQIKASLTEKCPNYYIQAPGKKKVVQRRQTHVSQTPKRYDDPISPEKYKNG